jgi:hypothetical protein
MAYKMYLNDIEDVNFMLRIETGVISKISE